MDYKVTTHPQRSIVVFNVLGHGSILGLHRTRGQNKAHYDIEQWGAGQKNLAGEVPFFIG